jgi:hypothetical protein
VKYPDIFSIDFVFSLMEVVLSALASPFACATMRGALHNIATKTTSHKPFDISAASTKIRAIQIG